MKTNIVRTAYLFRLRYRGALALVLLLSLALRLWGLDQHNIWWDEGLTAWAARLPVRQILDWTAHDVHPPLYFLFTRAWWLVLGDGAWGLRFLPALAGVLNVALVATLGHALGGRRAGLLAALFLAVSTFAVTWSQELRMYIWAALWAAGALWAAVRIWQGRGPRAWIAYVLCAAAGLWTLYLSGAVLAVTNLAFLWLWWRQGRVRRWMARWVAAQVGAVMLFLPWLIYALPRMMSWSSAEPYQFGFFVRLYTTVLATGAAVNLDAWLWPSLAVLAVLVVAAVALLRRRRRTAISAGLLMLVLALVLPALAVYALTALPGRSFYIPRLAPRYFLPLASAFYLLLGWGLAELGRRCRAAAWIGTGIVVGVALAGLTAFLPGRVQTDQYTSLAATLDAHRRSEDAVFLYPDEDWPLFAGQYAGSWLKVPAGMALTPESVENLLAGAWAGAEGAWLVTTPKAQETDPQGLVRGWLAERAAGQATWTFGETSLTLLARTPGRAATLWDMAPGVTPSTGSLGVLAGGELAAAQVPLRRYGTGDTLHLAIIWTRAPAAAINLTLAGPVARTAPVPASPASHSGLIRQVVSMPLLADLPAGDYQVSLGDAAGQTLRVGEFVLLARPAVRPIAADEITRPLNLRLGEHVWLLGYDLPKTTFRPDDVVPLTLYWRTDAPLAVRYKVFTHLLGTVFNATSDNFVWGQQDNEPVADQMPTTRWEPGAIVVDSYRIRLAANALPGIYTLEVGLYGLLDGVRLPVADADGQPQGDAIRLEVINVE